MKRTVSALYETQAQAEQARDALRAAHLGDHVDIRDQSGAGAIGVEGHHDFVAWLGDLFGGHHDKHVYGEGIRRGHFLLAAKVDDLNEIRAAEILDAQAPVDLERVQDTWRGEGWRPPARGAVAESSIGQTDVDTGGAPKTTSPAPATVAAPPAAVQAPSSGVSNPQVTLIGTGVRAYPIDG
jgi:hypothetical protein